MTSKLVQLYIINKSGGLIYQYEKNDELIEKTMYFEKSCDGLILEEKDDRLILAFGGTNNVKIGMTLTKVNDQIVKNKMVTINNENKNVIDLINDSAYFPLKLTFSRIQLKTNEKIMFASMFHS